MERPGVGLVWELTWDRRSLAVDVLHTLCWVAVKGP